MSSRVQLTFILLLKLASQMALHKCGFACSKAAAVSIDQHQLQPTSVHLISLLAQQPPDWRMAEFEELPISISREH